MRRRLYVIRVWLMGILSTSVFASDVFDTKFPYGGGSFTSKPTTNINEVLEETNQWGSFLENMLDLFGINYAWSGKALSFIQIIINYVLALVWFIALVLIIYSFYMIFFGKSDDAIAKARKTVIWATIAILIMWLSAYIVNLLFYIYSQGL